MSYQERVRLTTSCRDCDKIPKVENAGVVKVFNNEKIQYMFNGIKIHYECYHSPWMNKIITDLKGHHEPQEELCFYHVLNLLPEKANMLELGCAWAYYSMWFNHSVPASKNICIEPNVNKLNKGIANMNLNNLDSSEFVLINGYIGREYLENSVFTDWDNTKMNIPQYSIEKIINDNNNIFIDILHSDIQGAEGEMLIGCINVLKNIGFFVLSTHGNLHEKCMDFMTSNNFSILIQHTVEESVSADGLIIAVNNEHIHKYEKNIDVSIQKYFDENCHITKH
jgi:FkbM family methyltransferase